MKEILVWARSLAVRRVTPADSSKLAKIVSPGSGEPAIQTQLRAHHYGPCRIVDNYLEGSAENVMFGGATATIPNLVAQS